MRKVLHLNLASGLVGALLKDGYVDAGMIGPNTYKWIETVVDAITIDVRSTEAFKERLIAYGDARCEGDPVAIALKFVEVCYDN